MSISFEESMVWSKLCWEESWASCIDLDEILPKVNQVYPVSFRQYHSCKVGANALLWQPPQSDINGWYEDRPSEISKSYILQGELSNPSNNDLNFDFLIQNRIKLLDTFEQVDKVSVSPFHYLELEKRELDRWLRSAVGGYTYLFNRLGEYDEFEIILSQQDKSLCVHYLSLFHEYSGSRNEITRYTLNRREHYFFERILEEAKKVVDTSYDGVPENQVLGAKYQ